MTHRTRRNRWAARTAAAAFAISITTGLVACAPGGSVATSQSPAHISTKLTTKPVTITLYDSIGYPLNQKLAEEFHRQYPNVTVKMKLDTATVVDQNYARLLASNDSPDLARVGVQPKEALSGLLLNLDPYAKAYGWDKFMGTQDDPLRVNKNNTLGTGVLYGLGQNFSVDGIYYNKSLAKKIGMTTPPATLDELEADLKAAKAAGIVPIMTGGKDGVTNYPLQGIVNQYVKPQLIRNWVWDVPGSTINNPDVIKGAQRFADWAAAGYFPSDVNSVDYTTMVGRFTAGQGLFMFDGDWEAANVNKSMGSNVGFFLDPPLTASGNHVGMSAAGNLVISAKAPHKDVAAFFLDWTQRNPKARQIIVDVAGASPVSGAGFSSPKLPTGTDVADTIQSHTTLVGEGGDVPFLVDAAPGFFVDSATPELQLLVAGRTTAKAFVESLQAAYESDLSH